MNGTADYTARAEFVMRHAGWLVALLAVAASLTSLLNGFALDDIHIIAENERVHTLARPWEMFVQSYWPNALYRPLTILFFSLQWAAGGGSPLPFHAVNIVVYAAACVALYRMTRLIVPTNVALLASALFAVHPVHTEAVANAVGQPEMIVAALAFLSLEKYVRARRRGGPTVTDTAVIVFLYVVACLFKEHAVVLPALFVAAEVVVGTTSESVAARIRKTAPFFFAIAAAAVAFVVVRTLVLGGLASGTNEILDGQPFSVRLYTMLGVLPEWVRLFIWPAGLSADYSFQRIRNIDSFTLSLIPALLSIPLVVWVALRARKRNAAITFAILWVGVTMAIPSNVIMPTGFVLAERTLFLPSAGVMIIVAMAVAAAWHRMPRDQGLSRLVTATALVAIVVAGIARSSTRNPVWRDNLTLFRQTVEDVPTSARSHLMLGEVLGEEGDTKESLEEVMVAVRLAPAHDAMVLAYAAGRFVQAGRYRAALPLYERALELLPNNESLRSSTALCFLRVGRVQEARDIAAAGLSSDTQSKNLTAMVQLADSILATPQQQSE